MTSLAHERRPPLTRLFGYRWLGFPFVTRLVLRDLRRHRLATAVGATTGFVGGLALAGLGGSIGPVTVQSLAVVLLAVVPAALAGGTHPDQRHGADVLFRQGCRRTLIRLTAWAGAVAVVAVPAWIGAAVGATITREVGSDAQLESAWWGVLLPALGAWLTAGARLPEHTDRSVGRTRATDRSRLVVGIGIVVLSALPPTTAVNGFSLDLLLPVGLLLTVVGLAVLSPLVVRAGARGAGRLPSTAVRVASGVLDRNRRALSLPFALIAGATCVLVVQTVVGVGLGRREQDRLTATAALGPATAGTSPNQLIVSLSILDTGAVGSDQFEVRREALSTAVLQASPRATAVAVDAIHLEVRSGQPVYGDTGPDPLTRLSVGPQVAVATPSLLSALGLDPALAAGDRAVVLDPRLLDADGVVRLFRRADDGTVLGDARLPGRLGPSSPLVVEAPSVLVPADLVPVIASADAPGNDDILDISSQLVVVNFPTRPDDDTVRALRVASGGTVTRGDRLADVSATRRTDGIDSITIRTDADARRLVATLGVLCLAVVFVAQFALALAHRREDEVLDLLGTRRRTRTLIAGVRGLVIGLVATCAGASIALSATALGLYRYNSTGRFGDDVTLAPVPFSLPPPLLVGLAVLPLIAGAAGALVALARRWSDDRTRTERLAW